MERKTRQRDAIVKVFEHHHHPLTPIEILNAAQKDVKKLGIATVYRTLKGLVSDGTLVHVELPGEAPRYEMAGKEHHHHFHCSHCKKVFEIHGCPGDFKRLVPRGFKLEGHEITLYGTCKSCAQ
jgi:Fur family ferric uptake transcriptional regulator